MLRPDELRKQIAELDKLERMVKDLDQVRHLRGGRIFFNHHHARDLIADEVDFIRVAMVAYYGALVETQADALRQAGVDPTTVLRPPVILED